MASFPEMRFRDLVACIERGTRSVLRFLRIGYDAFEITACWANVLAKGASHRAHSHPMFSGFTENLSKRLW